MLGRIDRQTWKAIVGRSTSFVPITRRMKRRVRSGKSKRKGEGEVERVKEKEREKWRE